VLYHDGVKLGDTQATVVGMMIAFCFLFISNSKPLQQLSKERPRQSLFNFYVLLSLLGQFAIHMYSLMFVVKMAKEASPDRQKPDVPFEPNLLNTCVFLISSGMQVSTFAVNYKGRPFKQSLWEHRMLLYTLTAPGLLVLLAATEMVPPLNRLIECVEFPSDSFRARMLGVLLFDFVAAFVWERVCTLVLKDTR